jgi:Uma2 family endonuclease
MTAATLRQPISVEDYLAGELSSEVKHEYLGGFVYAMAGAKNVHNLIASNVLGVLHGQLRGGPCRPYNSDTKIRVKLVAHTRFYYPDASVVCQPNQPDESFQDLPVVIVEVASENTRRVDHSEKKDACLTIPSLQSYVLLEQDAVVATVYRRTEQGFLRDVYEGLDAVVPLPDVAATLPLAEAYNGVSFAARS